MLSIISLALAASTVDPGTVIGITLIILIIIGIASSGQKRLVKQFCPYCSRRINYAAPVARPVRTPPAALKSRGNTPLMTNRSKQMTSSTYGRRGNSPILSVMGSCKDRKEHTIP